MGDVDDPENSGFNGEGKQLTEKTVSIKKGKKAITVKPNLKQKELLGELNEFERQISGDGESEVTEDEGALNFNNGQDDKKVPLLDQPTIVEGNRQRKPIVNTEKKASIPQKYFISIPAGKGVALGRISVVYDRIKKLDNSLIKELHRLLFGKSFNSKITTLLYNIQQFRGFTFDEDSKEYAKRKQVFSCKVGMSELKSLVYVLDIDGKFRTKDEYISNIINFLMCPKLIRKTKSQSLTSRPKRKATRRNYFEADLEYENIKRKRKNKFMIGEKETLPVSDKKVSSKKKSKQSPEKDAAAEKELEQEPSPTLETDNNAELKKPAKKRKRNQVVEDEDEDEIPLSQIKSKTKNKTK